MAGRANPATVLALTSWIATCVSACEAEKRSIGPAPPQTPPKSASDPRTPRYQGNAYQISQGGTLFAWYGCQSCHGEAATGAANLGDDQWRNGGSIDRVYASIAQGRPDGMPAYATRVPVEQIWQLTAYVRDLHKIPAVKRRRQDLDQRGEPQGSTWSGAVRSGAVR